MCLGSSLAWARAAFRYPVRWKLVRMDGIGHVGGMDTRETPPALIIVAGPQASGKTPLRKASNASA